MRTFFATFRPAFLCLLLLTLLLGIIYPLFMYGIGQLFFHKTANGSLILQNGKVIGSEWIGQNFNQPTYFHPRPSSAGDKGYDAANSSGSNLGPTSQKLIDQIRDRATNYRAENQLGADILIPADAVTASASGLDPHISVENALLQASRIAQARNLPKEKIMQLIEKFTEGRDLGLFGEKRINVLRINLALDQMSAS